MVVVEAATPNTIFVGGLVIAPRPQSYPPGVRVSVLQALAAAGGLRLDVFPREATLIRRAPDGRDVHVKLDLNRLKNNRDPNFLLAAGDVLWVPHTVETRIHEWIGQNISLRAGAAANANVTYHVISGEDRMDRETDGGGTFIGTGP